MANRDLEKRLAAVEAAIIGNRTELIFCWTRSLAHRIEAALTKRGALTNRKVQTVCWPIDDADGAMQAHIRETDPKEAAYLDMLLEGRIPKE